VSGLLAVPVFLCPEEEAVAPVLADVLVAPAVALVLVPFIIIFENYKIFTHLLIIIYYLIN
jgi:hypothetical protein